MWLQLLLTRHIPLVACLLRLALTISDARIRPSGKFFVLELLHVLSIHPHNAVGRKLEHLK
jgi:hypothetical protein